MNNWIWVWYINVNVPPIFKIKLHTQKNIIKRQLALKIKKYKYHIDTDGIC